MPDPPWVIIPVAFGVGAGGGSLVRCLRDLLGAWRSAGPIVGVGRAPAPGSAGIARARLIAGVSAALVAAAVLAAAGQSSDSGGSATGASATAASATGAPAVVDTEAAEQATALISRAQHVLIARCARQHGFDLPVAAPPPRPASMQPVRPFAQDDARWARRHGLGSRLASEEAERVAAARAADPVAGYAAGLPPAEQQRLHQVLYGRPGDPVIKVRLPQGYLLTAPARGCQAAADQELYGDQRAWVQVSAIVESLPGIAVAEARRDAAYLRAQRRWARCMSRAGHPAASPSQLRRGFAERRAGMPSQRAWRLEVRLAVAEAECARATGFTAVADRVAAQRRAALADRYRAELAEHHRLRAVAAPRAARVVRSEPAGG